MTCFCLIFDFFLILTSKHYAKLRAARHYDALKEKESTIVRLRREVEELAFEGKETAGKISQLQADLDHEAEVQRGREVDLERLRGESRERETLLTQLSEARGELERRGSELQKDSEWQEASSESWRKDVELHNKESELQPTKGAAWSRRANVLRRQRRHCGRRGLPLRMRRRDLT